jgi:hypothetical protein
MVCYRDLAFVNVSQADVALAIQLVRWPPANAVAYGAVGVRIDFDQNYKCQLDQQAVDDRVGIVNKK